jgi:hypothetical protein
MGEEAAGKSPEGKQGRPLVLSANLLSNPKEDIYLFGIQLSYCLGVIITQQKQYPSPYRQGLANYGPLPIFVNQSSLAHRQFSVTSGWSVAAFMA